MAIKCVSSTLNEIQCDAYYEALDMVNKRSKYRGLSATDAEKLFIKSVRVYEFNRRRSGILSSEVFYGGKIVKGSVLNRFLLERGYKSSKTIVLDLYHTFINHENIYGRYVPRRGLPYTTRKGLILPAKDVDIGVYSIREEEAIIEIPEIDTVKRKLRQEIFTISSGYDRNVEIHIAIDTLCNYDKHVSSKTDIYSVFEFFIDNTFFVNMGLDAFIRGLSGDVDYLCGCGSDSAEGLEIETIRMKRLREHCESNKRCRIFELEIRYIDHDYGTKFNKSMNIDGFHCFDMGELRKAIHGWISELIRAEFKYNTYTDFVRYKEQTRLKIE